MHALDIAIVTSLGFAALNGARTGFVRQIIRLATYVAAAYGTAYFHQPAAELILDTLGDRIPAQSRGLVADIAAWVVVFPLLFAVLTIAVHLLRQSLSGWHAGRLPTAEGSLFPKALDRLAGAGVSVVFAGLMLGTGLALSSLIPSPKLEEKLAGSKLRLPLVQSVQAVAAAIPQEYKDEFTAAINRLKDGSASAAGNLLGQGLQSVTQEVNQLAGRLDELKTNTGGARFANGIDPTSR